MTHGVLPVGVGGPIGSGKAALVLSLCQVMRDRQYRSRYKRHLYEGDAQFLVRHKALRRNGSLLWRQAAVRIP